MTRKKRILIAVIPLLLIIITVWCITSSYILTYKANWGFSLPWTALCREIYAADSGASFHGDGIRCHIYSYQYEDDIDNLFAWAAHRTTDSGASCADTAALWLDTLAIPTEFRPDLDACTVWYHSKSDGSELIILLCEEENRIFILEQFI